MVSLGSLGSSESTVRPHSARCSLSPPYLMSLMLPLTSGTICFISSIALSLSSEMARRPVRLCPVSPHDRTPTAAQTSRTDARSTLTRIVDGRRRKGCTKQGGVICLWDDSSRIGRVRHMHTSECAYTCDGHFPWWQTRARLTWKGGPHSHEIGPRVAHTHTIHSPFPQHTYSAAVDWCATWRSFLKQHVCRVASAS